MFEGLNPIQLPSPSESSSVWTYMKTNANKKRTVEDPLYTEGNTVCGIQLQYVAVDEDEEELLHTSAPAAFQCSVPGCGRWLDSVYQQEVHYGASHRHGCGLCRGQLPSYHALQLHLEESHDALFAVRCRRQPMYRCYVESCEVLSSDPDSRRQHCISQHCFPADFCLASRPPPPDVTRTSDVTRKTGGVMMRLSDDASSDVPYWTNPITPFSADAFEPAEAISPASDAASRTGDVTSGTSDVTAGRRPRARFSYRVPEGGVQFGAAAVPSLRRADPEDTGIIDMASLAAALDEETL